MQLLQRFFFYVSYSCYVYGNHEFDHDDGVHELNDDVAYFVLPSLFICFCLINNFWQ